MTARLLMVGIDGADGQWLDDRSADGSLPHLAGLRAEGRAHRLTSSPGVTDDAIWASFQYETELGEHGRYNFRLPLANGELGMAHEEELDRSAFWDDLSSDGMRVAVLDVPKCREPRPINGIHLADWSVHGRYFYDQPHSHPPSLAAEVLERFGSAQPSRCSAHQPFLRDEDVLEIAGNLRASVAQKRAAGVHYLESEAWDLFVVGFKEAHCASHAFWDLTAGHPSHDIERGARHGNPAMDVLRDIDDAIGALVARAGSDAEIVVFSTTEYQANGSLDHLMSGILRRLNARLPARHGGGLARLLNQLFARSATTSPDWRVTLLPYNENCSALRVARSRKPRFAQGDEAPDTEILRKIEDRLIGLCDADTGKPVVSAITRPSSEFAGSRARSLPDLLIHWAGGVIPRAVVSPDLGRIRARPPSLRTGNHVAGGFLLAAGRLAPALGEEVRSMADFGPLVRKVLAGNPA